MFFFVAENIYAYKQGPTSSENCVPRRSRNFLGLLARTLFVLYSLNINDTSLPTGTSLTNGFSHLLKDTEFFKTAASLLRVQIIIHAIMGKYQASNLISSGAIRFARFFIFLQNIPDISSRWSETVGGTSK